MRYRTFQHQIAGATSLLLLLLCSCSQGNALLSGPDAGALQLLSVSFDGDVSSRSSDVTSVRDLSVYTTTTGNAAYGSNPLAVYTLSGGTWNTGSAPVISTDAKVYAFYPSGGSVANSSAGNHSVAVQVKQADTFSGAQADYLYSGVKTTTGTSHSVVFAMKHALSKVSFKINKSVSATENLTLEKIEILSPTNRLQAGDGSMNLSTGVLNGLVTTSSVVLTGSVTLNTQQSDPNVSCLVAPMNGQESVLSFRLTVKVSGETSSRTFATKAMKSVQWGAGKHYVYSVKVDKMSAELTGISVDAWRTDANQTTSIGI